MLSPFMNLTTTNVKPHAKLLWHKFVIAKVYLWTQILSSMVFRFLNFDSCLRSDKVALLPTTLFTYPFVQTVL